MNALMQSAVVTAREFALQGARHAHQAKMLRHATALKWLTPTNIIALVILSVIVTPVAAKAAGKAKEKLQERRDRKVESYVEQQMARGGR